MVRSIAGLGTDLVPLGAMGPDEVELALFNVAHHFDLVGFVDTIDADAAQLGRLLGRQIGTVRRENQSVVSRWSGETEQLVDWARVDDRNRFDRLLYDRLRASPRLARSGLFAAGAFA